MKNLPTTQQKQIDRECQTQGGYSSIMDRNMTEGVADVRKIRSGKNVWGITSDVSIYNTTLACTASYKLIAKQCLRIIRYNNIDHP
jgi:hypothetical protein